MSTAMTKEIVYSGVDESEGTKELLPAKDNSDILVPRMQILS